MTLPPATGEEDRDATSARKRRRLRIVLITVTVVAASAVLAWGYLGFYTDILVLRQTPIQRLASPDGAWELRVYEVAEGSPYEDHGGVWLAAVAPTADRGAEQRTVYHGGEATFSWSGDDTLLVRGYLPGQEHSINVVHGSYGVEDHWAGDEHGLRFVFAIMWLGPVSVVALVGVAATLLLPRLIWRDRSASPATASPVAGMEPDRDA